MDEFQSLESQDIPPGPADVSETAIQTFTVDEELENAEGQGLSAEGEAEGTQEGTQEKIKIEGEGEE